jgi:hypothetical protein
MAEIQVVDPFKGKKYSVTYMSEMDKNPTHPMIKVPGTGKASWDRTIGRWVV